MQIFQISIASWFLDYISSVPIQIAQIAQTSRLSANMNKKICQACLNHLVCNQAVMETQLCEKVLEWSRENCGKLGRTRRGHNPHVGDHHGHRYYNNPYQHRQHHETNYPARYYFKTTIDNCVCSSQQNWQRISSQLTEPNLQCTSTIALVLAFPGVLTINISWPSQVILLRCPKNKSQLIIVGNRGQVS